MFDALTIDTVRFFDIARQTPSIIVNKIYPSAALEGLERPVSNDFYDERILR